MSKRSLRKYRTYHRVRQTTLVLALLAVLTPVHAEDEGVEEIGTVTLGVGGLIGGSADKTRLGQYSGLRGSDASKGILGLTYSLRNEEAGTELLFSAPQLLGDNREALLRWAKQGDWKFGASYDQLVHVDPNTVHSAMLGAGTTTPQLIASGSGNDLELRVRRTALGVSVWKSISDTLSAELSLKTEHKTGARLFGVGMTCPSLLAKTCSGPSNIQTGSAVLLLPEPIDANHSQIEGRLSYAGEKLRVSLGYYGSFYANQYDTLTPSVPSSLYNSVGSLLTVSPGLLSMLSQPVALTPDNQAHQLDLSGVYQQSARTQYNFKLSWGQATQHQNFAASGFSAAPAGVSDLGGKVETVLAQIGASTRITPKLSVQGDVRYEDRNDLTPIANYNVIDTSTYTNRSLPNTKRRSKAQAAYQFSTRIRGTVGAEYETIDRGVFTATSAVSGISALRQKTDESKFRADLRASLTEELSGSIGVETSRRDGSNWLKDNSGTGVTAVSDPSDAANGFSAGAIFMPTLADRNRDKLKLHLEWQPLESTSIQLTTDRGRDRFHSPSKYGLSDTTTRNFGLDITHTLSDNWSLNGYASQAFQVLHQALQAGYLMSFKNTTDSFGLGVTGRSGDKWEVGATLSYLSDRNVYLQELDASTDGANVALLAGTGGLPDVVYRQTSLNLFGKYKLNDKSSLRLDLIEQHSHYTDWTWAYQGTAFTYADGSTVWQKPDQSVLQVRLSYNYRWR
jgi:MtrB/PioB family decaheme-associated outer membrane protein